MCFWHIRKTLIKSVRISFYIPLMQQICYNIRLIYKNGNIRTIIICNESSVFSLIFISSAISDIVDLVLIVYTSFASTVTLTVLVSIKSPSDTDTDVQLNQNYQLLELVLQ
jgi:hypothetical protein